MLYANSGKHDFNSLIAIYDFRSYFLPKNYTKMLIFCATEPWFFYMDSVGNSTAAEFKKKNLQALVWFVIWSSYFTNYTYALS